jgi:hypothetical protein
MIPQLGQLFGSGSEVSNRNIAAAKVVADTVVQATQSTNVQDAIEKMQGDGTVPPGGRGRGERDPAATHGRGRWHRSRAQVRRRA